jgi:hypothetical protein
MATFGFSEGDAKRIGNVVRAVERHPPTIRLQSPVAEGAAPGVRLMLGTHGSAAWNKQTLKTITITGGTPGTNGIPTASALTVAAYNIFANIPAKTASTARWVAVSNNGFSWYVIAAECD